MHDDGVADLGLDGRPQQAQVLPLGGAGLEVGEGGVGVLAVQRLDVDLADAVRALLDKDVLGLTERLAGDVVEPQRRVVPADLIGGDEIGAGPAAAGGLPPASSPSSTTSPASIPRVLNRRDGLASDSGDMNPPSPAQHWADPVATNGWRRRHRPDIGWPDRTRRTRDERPIRCGPTGPGRLPRPLQAPVSSRTPPIPR